MKRLLKKLLQFLQQIMTAIFEKNCRKRLKNHGFTLLTSTCIGGVIYHRLGEEFRSPTINLWIAQPEFCEFVSDLEYYLSQPLEFYHEPTRDCPVARLGGKVSVAFVHYKTPQEAEAAWQRRKARINYDNLFIITSDGNGLTPEDAQKLGRVNCRRKIILTSRERPELPDSFCLRSMKGAPSAATHQVALNRLTGRARWEDEFDFVAWLNGEENFRK